MMIDASGEERVVEREALDDEHSMEAEADLEARMATLAERVIELEGELSAAKSTLETRDRDAAIEEIVEASGAIEPESVRALVERALASDPGLGVEGAMACVRERKPVLFRDRSARGSVMGAGVKRAADAGLAAARVAAADGDRASLLRYLRLRREQG